MRTRNFSVIGMVAVAGVSLAMTGCQGSGSAAQGAEPGDSALTAGHTKSHSAQREARGAAKNAAHHADHSHPSGAHGAQQTSLVTAAKGQKHSASVRVPSGAYEAASWDTKGNIWFWSNAGGTWHRIGSSRYPMIPGSNGNATKVASTLLPGMSHAAYIADGTFTGDSTGNTILFAATSHGKWGTVAPKNDGGALIPTGKPATDNTTPGIWRDARFTGGKVETTVGNPFMANAGASAYPLITDWYWQSGKFVKSSSNAFRSHVVGAPKPPVRSPLHDCPTKLPNGTYFGGISTSEPSGNAPYSTVTTVFSDPNGGDFCSLQIGANTPVTTPATTTSGKAWVTVPAWMLQTTFKPGAGVTKVYPDEVKGGKSPLVAPALRSLRPNLGNVRDYSVAAHVVVKDGKVTAFELTKH